MTGGARWRVQDVQFVSDIGGTLGLWIGLSVLSIMEVGQLVVELLRHFCCCRWRVNSWNPRQMQIVTSNWVHDVNISLRVLATSVVIVRLQESDEDSEDLGIKVLLIYFTSSAYMCDTFIKWSMLVEQSGHLQNLQIRTIMCPIVLCWHYCAAVVVVVVVRVKRERHERNGAE